MDFLLHYTNDSGEVQDYQKSYFTFEDNRLVNKKISKKEKSFTLIKGDKTPMLRNRIHNDNFFYELQYDRNK